MLITPLEGWISAKIGVSDARLDIEALQAYQLERLNRTLTLVQTRSRFYRDLLGTKPLSLCTLDEIQSLPFTTADDIRRAPFDLLCVKQDDVDRIVTLPTSGTTGAPKRIFFTAEDQELTRDFFHWGMSTLVDPGERVLILMPGTLPGSIGALLEQGLARMDVRGIQHGPVSDPAATLAVMEREQVTCLVGIPVQVLALAKTSLQPRFRNLRLDIRSVLLSTDYVPATGLRVIEAAWGCKVFNHYGTTEMGLGGGVDCVARSGYHLREADMLFEVVNPATGAPVPDGIMGEVVFTTLTRQAMPLIRYRTGDAGRFLPGSCPCGTVLRRLEHIQGRLAGAVMLPGGAVLMQRDFDEALLGIEGVADFRVEIRRNEAQLHVKVAVRALEGSARLRVEELVQAIETIPALGEAGERVQVKIHIAPTLSGEPTNPGTNKRQITLVEESVS
jgi:phenylacetate-CoA ligase